MNISLDCLIIVVIKRRNSNEHIRENITCLPDLTGSSDTDENNLKQCTGHRQRMFSIQRPRVF